MKIFLSAMEQHNCLPIIKYLLENNIKTDYLLISYYYLRRKDTLGIIKKVCSELLVDSGAHSFQKGTRVEWESYTKEYAEWIKENDCPQILGYFEMDMDNIIGYEKVLYLRKILENVSNKIIPVWHQNRGCTNFKEMCRQYKFASITGFKNEDIKDEQYIMFLKYARKYNCKIHCLGMTRTNILNTVPFYSVDSSSWKQSAIYGNYTKFVNGRFKSIKQPKNITFQEIMKKNFLEHIQAQKYFYNKWKNFKKWFGKIPRLKLRTQLNEQRIIIVY